MYSSTWALQMQDLLRYKRADTAVNITPREFKQWKRQSIVDALCGKRPEHSFCEYFNIYDNILSFSRCWKYSEKYIQKTYISCKRDNAGNQPK